MHEATIACAILDHAVRRLSMLSQPAVISAVYLRVGEFRNVDPESLKFAFNALRNSYQNLADCQLIVEIVPAKALCHANGHEYHAVPESLYRCNKCASGIGHLRTGEELDITGITIIDNETTEKDDYARTHH